jgi:peptidoglycan hydrolase CwlO-like protein
MRRLVVLLVVVVGLVRPAFADDVSAKQQTVQQQLVAASVQLTDLNMQMDALQRSVTDTQSRIQQERQQVRILARALYAQPDSLVAMVFESASLSDAMTRIADLTSAGDRAAATTRALNLDLSRLSEQHDQIIADQARMTKLKTDLEKEFSQLVAQAMNRPASPAPAVTQDTSSVAAIKQIIMDAFAPLGAAGQNWALAIARCESNYNPYAVNRSSGASGLFQFLPSTWAGSPYASQSVFDPVANAKAAEWLYNRSGAGQWQCKA